MKSKTKDKIAIAWAYFGALIFGTLFMLGDSGNITGGVIKVVYDSVSTAFVFLEFLVFAIFIYLVIYNLTKYN